MIAEINNKISSTGSNLNDRLEDQLTGDFFGTLRYLPFATGLQKILGSKYVFPDSAGEYINNLSYKDEPKYLFWKRLKDVDGTTVEPDLIIELGETVICIEVKYNSGLSSDDWASDSNGEPDNHDISDEVIESRNQLAREARAISRAYKGKNLILILIFIARDEVCEEVFNGSAGKIEKGVQLARISWSDIYEAVDNLNYTSRIEELIFHDIHDLLERKSFDRFKCVNLKECKNLVIETNSFKFDYKPAKIEFKNTIEIEGDLYYEFR